MPVIGSGFARAQMGKVPLLTLLLTSYVTAAMERPVGRLTIYVQPQDLSPAVVEVTAATA